MADHVARRGELPDRHIAEMVAQMTAGERARFAARLKLIESTPDAELPHHLPEGVTGLRTPREFGVLFKAPLVRAILAGVKTQTRRVLKPGIDRDFGCELAAREIAGEMNAGEYRNSPFGQPGDRLWVREAFSGPYCMEKTTDRPAVPPGQCPHGSPIWFWADGNPTEGDWTRPRPSIHMPRWASRLTLELTDVRAEKLHDIDEVGARAEGADARPRPPGMSDQERALIDLPLMDLHTPYRNGFATLWETTGGNWAANPWVVVLTFKRIEQGAHGG